MEFEAWDDEEKETSGKTFDMGLLKQALDPDANPGPSSRPSEDTRLVVKPIPDSNPGPSTSRLVKMNPPRKHVPNPVKSSSFAAKDLSSSYPAPPPIKQSKVAFHNFASNLDAVSSRMSIPIPNFTIPSVNAPVFQTKPPGSIYDGHTGNEAVRERNCITVALRFLVHLLFIDPT